MQGILNTSVSHFSVCKVYKNSREKMYSLAHPNWKSVKEKSMGNSSFNHPIIYLFIGQCWNWNCVVYFHVELHFIPVEIYFHIYLDGFVSKRAILRVKTIAVHFEGWQYIVSHTSVTTYQKCFIFQQWWSKREKWVYFYPKLVASRIRCLHLEISHTFHCTRVQALIIHPETLADAAWLFTYLEVCLPLRLHLQLSIRSVMHSPWRIAQ